MKQQIKPFLFKAIQMRKHFFRLALGISLVLGMVACTTSRKAGGCKVNAGYVGY